MGDLFDDLLWDAFSPVAKNTHWASFFATYGVILGLALYGTLLRQKVAPDRTESNVEGAPIDARRRAAHWVGALAATYLFFAVASLLRLLRASGGGADLGAFSARKSLPEILFMALFWAIAAHSIYARYVISVGATSRFHWRRAALVPLVGSLSFFVGAIGSGGSPLLGFTLALPATIGAVAAYLSLGWAPGK